jgi:hypothetical protein
VRFIEEATVDLTCGGGSGSHHPSARKQQCPANRKRAHGDLTGYYREPMNAALLDDAQQQSIPRPGRRMPAVSD